MANELFPSDTDINNYLGTDYGTDEIPLPSIGQSTFYTNYSQAFYRLNQMAKQSSALRVFKTDDLTFGVRAGIYTNGDALVSYTETTANALTDNNTNYIYLTTAGVLTTNTTGFPTPSTTPHIPLATILTASGTYDNSDITDYRGRVFLNPVSGMTAENANSIKGLGTLTDTYIYVGNGSNVPVGVAVSGDISIANDGEVTIDGIGLETASVDGIADTEIMIGNGVNSANFAVLSGDVSMTNAGVVTVSGVTTANLETATLTGIADTEILIGDGVGSGVYVSVSGDATLANTGALTIANNAITEAKCSTSLQDKIVYCTVDISDNANGTGTITIQAKDAAGNNLSQVCLLRTIISTTSYGTAAVNVTQLAATTGTILNEYTTDIDASIQTDSSGTAVLTVTNSANETLYARSELGGLFVEDSVAITGN